MRLRLKLKILFIILVLATPTVFAQASTLDSFLSSAWSSSALRLQKKNLEVYGEAQFVNPIDVMQLRLEQKEDLQIKTGIRLNPKGFSEYRMLQALHAQESRLEQMDFKESLAAALESRYFAILDYMNAQEKQQRLSRLLEVVRKNLRMTQAASRSSSGDTIQLLKVREELEEVQLKLSAVKSQIRIYLLKLKSQDSNITNDPQFLKTLPNPKELLLNLKKLAAEKPSAEKTLIVRKAEESAQKARNLLAMDLSRDSKLIDFVEVGFVNDAKVNERKYTVQLAINIPGFTATSFSQREKSRELVKYEIDIQATKNKESLEIESLKQDIEQAAELYEVLYGANFIAAESKVQNLARRQNPLMAVSLEKTSAERAFRAQEITYSANKSYLAYLAKTDAFFDQPDVNFLSKDLTWIKR